MSVQDGTATSRKPVKFTCVFVSVRVCVYVCVTGLQRTCVWDLVWIQVEEVSDKCI